ncbi:glycosyl hydrolase family 47-domain-containing protein [Lophiotrema nucula]|uniref:alpha-1,2-Mannosidase n=1 Tax=Lophiotrema nucula TaxID=690887 RepID=A0A6A5Z4D2_9PLEO|nr:glycosyl hydrolase family 47-domain-containing protein [Lophiotrema nucula]
MRPRIRMPRQASYAPLTRRHRRTLWLVLSVVAVFAVLYVYSKPIDRLAISFEQHEDWMNDRTSINGFVAKGSYDWRKAPFHNKPASYKPLPVGKPRTLPPVQFAFPTESSSQKALRERRRVAVRDEFERSWTSYKTFAWGKDELMPTTGQAHNAFGGWGATLVDSLDTLWMMGFKEDFYATVGAVAEIDFGETDLGSISVFETTIRYLGGLLAAYDLSREMVLLDKAIQMGEMLYRAFDTENNTPLDRMMVELAKKDEGGGFAPEHSICLAGFGSLTMEFTRLAQITQDPKYYDAVARLTDIMDRGQNMTRIPGLLPIWVNAREESLENDRTFTVGAMADSTYEYFPKTYALLGGLEPVYKKLYLDSAAQIDKHLLYRPMLPDSEPGDELLYCGDVHLSSNQEPKVDAEMQHLTCFVGGFFALAGRLFEDAYHVDLGAKLTEGCIYAYKSLPTGIMPEIFNMVACDDRVKCSWNQTKYEEEVLRKTYGKDHDDFAATVKDQKLPPGFTQMRDKRYLLRPEAIESVFIMYRITGHQEYLDHAWDMFTSIVKYSRTRFANGQIFDVTDDSTNPISTPEDKMESFWLAETLKYFYLIFSPPDMISLDDWVLNTEAHPFRRPKLIKMEKGG